MTKPVQDPGAPGASASAASIVPRIKHLAFEQALIQADVPPAQRPLIEPLCGELVVTYAFDLPEQFVMATAAQMEAAGVPVELQRRLAVNNLRAAMKRDGSSVQFRKRDAVYSAECGGDIEACLLLVDDFWNHVQQEFGSDIVAAVPRRDRLLFACGPDASALQALREQAASFLKESDDAHGLSDQLMERVSGGWRVLSQ